MIYLTNGPFNRELKSTIFTSLWKRSSMIFFCIPSSVAGSTTAFLPCKAAGHVSAFFIFCRFTFSSPPSDLTAAEQDREQAVSCKSVFIPNMIKKNAKTI